MADNSRAINRVFTRGVIQELLHTGSNDIFDYVVNCYVENPDGKTHGKLFSEIYAYLGHEKRNEYYYLNTLLMKLLAGSKHNVNTTTALSQVRIGKHIADFVMINGEGKVYEIKSDLDNLGRLREQLSDYFRAFSKVSVLAAPRELAKVEHTLLELGDVGKAVGIYVLSEHDTIFGKVNGRDPKQFDDYLDHTCIFKLLRKKEYENVLISHFGVIPEVVPVYHFRACLEQFKQIPISKAQKLAFDELKKRNKVAKNIFENIQDELKSIIYFSRLYRELPNIEQLLQTNYRG